MRSNHGMGCDEYGLPHIALPYTRVVQIQIPCYGSVIDFTCSHQTSLVWTRSSLSFDKTCIGRIALLLQHWSP